MSFEKKCLETEEMIDLIWFASSTLLDWSPQMIMFVPFPWRWHLFIVFLWDKIECKHWTRKIIISLSNGTWHSSLKNASHFYSEDSKGNQDQDGLYLEIAFEIILFLYLFNASGVDGQEFSLEDESTLILLRLLHVSVKKDVLQHDSFPDERKRTVGMKYHQKHKKEKRVVLVMFTYSCCLKTRWTNWIPNASERKVVAVGLSWIWFFFGRNFFWFFMSAFSVSSLLPYDKSRGRRGFCQEAFHSHFSSSILCISPWYSATLLSFYYLLFLDWIPRHTRSVF